MTSGSGKKAPLPALLAAALALFILHADASAGFRDAQLGFARFRDALSEKGGSVRRLMARRGIGYPPEGIFLRIFKAERLVELWARGRGDEGYTFVTSYEFCDTSGGPGPKRRAGDGQIPEGFYHIERFNPESAYYLSLGIDYPNEHDRALGWSGGDIYIHGGCRTIGCVPLTDEKIKELYVIAAETRARGQRSIPVHIFPARFDGALYQKLREIYGGDRDLIAFWEDLRRGYEIFERTRIVPEVEVDRRGRYAFVSDTVEAALIKYILASPPRAPSLRFRLGTILSGLRAD
jgi:murein L,D-transpeptidase YafK